MKEVYPDAKVQLEMPIKARKRVADVLVELPSGWSIAHEIQLASITPNQLEERTRDYALEGIDVIWWFGSNMSPQCREWVLEREQAVYILDFEEVSDDKD